MGSNDIHKNKLVKKELLLIVLLMVIAVIFLSIGVTFNRLSKPKNIYSKTITSIYNYTNNMMSYEKKDTNLGNNIKSNYQISLNIHSDEDIFNTGYNRFQLYKYYNNLSRTKTNISFNQDLTNKKLLYIFDSKINNQTLTNQKILVDDSTKYEYLEGFKNNYINLGNAIYFETINSDKDINYNISYIKEFILNSFIENMNTEDINIHKEKTLYNDQKVKLIKYEYKLDDMKLRLLLNGIIKDIKKDERANHIISIINPDFKKYKISSKKRLLNKHEYLEFSIYTNNLYHIKKFEFGKIDSTKKDTISFEPTSERIRITTSENDQIKTITTLVKNKDNYVASMVDTKEKGIGSIEFDREEKRTTLIVGYSNDKKIDINYDRNIIKLDENKRYTQEITLSISIIDSFTMKKLLNLNFSCINNVSKYVKIEEEVSNVLLYDTLTQQEKEYKSLEKERIKKKLLR